MKRKILALGDCNTEGDKYHKNNSYPEMFASLLGYECLSYGYTMSTTREMKYFYKDYFSESVEIILIQYGLVDSWKTFKYAPYVLYYPDNIFRKISRKIVKKYKKLAKNFGLTNIFGSEFLVSPLEYKENIESLIRQSLKQKIFLIDTVPNKDLKRNDAITYYNNILTDLSKQYDNCIKIDLYETFYNNLDNFYIDDTHINSIGYDFIAKKLLEEYNKC